MQILTLVICATLRTASARPTIDVRTYFVRHDLASVIVADQASRSVTSYCVGRVIMSGNVQGYDT